MELEPEAIERFLETWPVARLATLAADGTPELVPIVFAQSGGALWSPVDGKAKQGRELSRVRNVRADPRVSVLLDHYDADWSRLWWLRVDGRAEVLGLEAPGAAAAAEALRAKYPRYAAGVTPLFAGVPTLLRIERLRAFGWRA
jgi:PPOX class probable F420-dependent enzyme